jgi:hypothetical protein
MALLFLAGCREDRVVTADQAIAVSRSYLVENHSGLDPEWAVKAIDMGDRWRVSYGWPGMAGEYTVVVVNKRSGKIVHMETGQ